MRRRAWCARFMEKATPPAAAPTPSPTGIHRLILAASAAGALATLCWAGLQLRAARSEVRQLQEKLAGMAPAPNPAPPPGDSTADLARRLAAAEAQQKQAADKSAARLAELESVIIVLRKENTAAQQTIERLSSLQTETAPEPDRTKSQKLPAANGNP